MFNQHIIKKFGVRSRITLSRHFRGAMVSKLRRAWQAGELPRVTDSAEPRRTLEQVMGKAWVVYSKSCVNHTRDVVSYLARYSHRTAIGSWLWRITGSASTTKTTVTTSTR